MVVQHLALEVESTEALETAMKNLQANDVEVLGPVDHGFIRSIYFYDPSGHRLELACRTIEPGDLERYESEAVALLEDWTERKHQPEVSA